jgi:hypothetical protein
MMMIKMMIKMTMKMCCDVRARNPNRLNSDRHMMRARGADETSAQMPCRIDSAVAVSGERTKSRCDKLYEKIILPKNKLCKTCALQTVCEQCNCLLHTIVCCERRRRHLSSLESTELLDLADADDNDAAATDADAAGDAADVADVDDEAVVAARPIDADDDDDDGEEEEQEARSCCFGLLSRELRW